ncbi:GntR family transcriptional regulator [Rudaeicoccus suwonensis]|uniref:GntR family transcriptional regulator n=1 Tax=Rudaeicoccus suwonensis TaxID=657409 RepID=A0A561E9P6_9MICO|nr:GntR family transcriptional regulator [Rudaeicoccus suwonensis]TWE12335.1 GntR family transcriptional regulator [Rudaeicoccus suwonensis]
MRVHINRASPIAPYQQICEQIAAQIQAGELPVGTRLPTVRALAAEVSVAPNTAAKAYSELEQAGLIETAGRAGTRVAAAGDASRALAAAAAADFADRVKRLGLPADDLVALVRAALAD